MIDGSLSERMAATARDLQDQKDPQATIDLAAHLAVANIDGAEAAGVAVVHASRRIDTEAATDEMATRGDYLQYETGQGPCLDAIWEEHTVYSPNLAHDARWPIWGPRVVEETGAQSVLSFRLFIIRNTLGALNLYSRTRSAFDDTDQEEGLAIAAHIAIAVTAAREIEDLEKAIDSRTVIGQATGVLMAQYSIGPTQAFAVLCRVSSTTNVKVRDLAAEIVATRRLPD